MSSKLKAVINGNLLDLIWLVIGGLAELRAINAELLEALANIRDTVESCYVAGGWVPMDAEEMQDIAGIANAVIAKAKGEA